MGICHIAPIILPVVPFGLVLGLAISDSDVPNLAGWLSSPLMFGGAAQLTAVTLLGQGAGALTVLAAVFTINARHVMYSAAIAPRYRSQPRWFRWSGPYFMVDQIFALSVTRDDTPDNWRAYYLGASLSAWVLWQVVTAAGILLGPAVPTGLEIGFIVPALFLSLTVPTLVRRPAVVAAVVGAVVAAATWQVPNRGGIIVGGVAGVLAGYLADRPDG